LGASFYHLIDGEAPPNSQSRLAAIAEGRDDPYRPLSGRIAGYPAGILESIDMSLKVLPNERLQTARAWINLIDAAGPFAAPKPLDFDFDAIRDEVARIAEEFEDFQAIQNDLNDATAEDQTPQEALELTQEDLNFELPPRPNRHKAKARLAVVCLSFCLLLSGSYYLTGFIAPERVAALAILTAPEGSPDTYRLYSPPEDAPSEVR